MHISTATPITSDTSAARASFLGLLRGEARKIMRLRITWLMALLYTGILTVLQLVLATGPHTADQLRGDPLGGLYNVMEGDLSLVRIFSGIFLLVLTAHVVGLDYQQGLRVVLARGVGRVQLLGAKTLTLALAGLGLFIWGCALQLGFGVVIVRVLAGGSAPWTALNGQYWSDTAYYALCVLISIGATLLLGIAASAVGRSLAFGLAVGLSWFAVDNLAIIALNVAYQITHQDFWRELSGYSLGLLLNRLPDYLVPSNHVVAAGPGGSTPRVSGFGLMPLVPVTAAHAVIVITLYATIFAVVAIVLTARRDVSE
jgi:ABC-2 type transport system permease protein